MFMALTSSIRINSKTLTILLTFWTDQPADRKHNRIPVNATAYSIINPELHSFIFNSECEVKVSIKQYIEPFISQHY